MKKFLALLLAACMLLAMVPAMAETATDTVVVMVPPVTGTYLTDMQTWVAEIEAKYPQIHVEVIETSWDDHSSKLSTMAQAGEAPDIAEVSYSAIGTYVDMGVGVALDDLMDLSDYDQNALDYMTIEGKVYGLPLYITIQALGANKEMLQAAGADVAKIQSEGWTFDEFLSVIAAGTTDSTYGFVFADSGVTAYDFLSVFGVAAGITNAFNSDLKYTYTSDNMLKLLEAVQTMTSSGYMPNFGVEAGQRMVMCEQGKAMIFGKAMPLFENNIKKNNAAIAAADGTAVENSITMDYAFLPVPTMDGVTESCFGSVDGLIALRNNNTTDEHLANVALVLDYLCSGDRAALVDSSLLLNPVCQSGRDVYANYAPEGLDEGNVAAAARSISLVVAPPAGVTAEQSANAITIRDSVIVPHFQALLAGEEDAATVFAAIQEAAYETFGEENCVKGAL